MNKIFKYFLIVSIFICLSGCSQQKEDLIIKDYNWTCTEDEYYGGYNFTAFIEFENLSNYDFFNHKMLTIKLYDKDGDVLEQQDFKTGFIFSKNVAYNDYEVDVSKYPSDVSLELNEIPEDYDSTQLEYPSSKSLKMDEIIKIKNQSIEDVSPNNTVLHKEYVGEFVNTGKYDFSKLNNYPFTVTIQAIFYKDDKMVGIESDYTDIFAYQFEENHVEEFGINPIFIKFEDTDKYDEIVLYPCLTAYV